MANEQGDAQVAASAGRSRRLWPVVIVALLMGAEGVGIFILAKAISPSPAPAVADQTGGKGSLDADEAEGLVEIELAECRPSNRTSGKFVTFHVRVSALVSAADQERAEKMARDKRARVEDGVNTVIRRAELKHLNEPDLQTLKRHLKLAFDRIFEDDQLIKEVIIPQFLQSGPGL